jgi:hypothetical protein
LTVGEHDSVVTFHSRNDVLPCDLVTNGLIFGTGDKFVEVEFWRRVAGGFCVLRVEFDGLGARR